MGIYDLLLDYGEVDYSIYFNGQLSDYCNSHPGEFDELFEKMIAFDDKVNIYVNYELNINQEVLSNKIIGYRDVTKIPNGAIKIPFIIYWQYEGHQRALLLSNHNYYEAKGMYYCISEPGNVMEEQRGEILATYLNEENQNDVYNCYVLMHDNNKTVGSLQRKYDSENVKDIEQMKDACSDIAKTNFDEVKKELNELEDKEAKAKIIYSVVGQTFLLKKAIYVCYMLNKHLLNERHSGNVVEQRKFAKAYCNDIAITPIYELWNNSNKEQ